MAAEAWRAQHKACTQNAEKLAEERQGVSFYEINAWIKSVHTFLLRVRDVSPFRSTQAYALALETLLLYATNVVNNKGEEVFRVMRMSNRMLRARLLTHGGGLRCILCLGFRPVSMGRDTWLVMVDMPKELPNLQVSSVQAAAHPADGS